jgi:thiamine pyrophosphate-dependent acetolactate synthase large subunit-like protein
MAYDMRNKLAEYGNGLKVIVFRDETLGMVDHWQNLIYRGRKTATSLENVPPKFFKKMAEQYEFSYYMADYRNIDGIDNDRILEEFVKHRGNAVLEIRMEPIPALPMIPSMKGVADTILPYGKISPEDLIIGMKK